MGRRYWPSPKKKKQPRKIDLNVKINKAKATKRTKIRISGTGVFSKVGKEFYRGAKKAAKRTAKKINRAITKKVRKYASKLERRKKLIKKWADKARNLAKQTDNTLEQFELAGYDIENRQLIDRTLDRVSEIENKTRPTENDLQIMRELASATRYDYIKIKMNIRGDEIDGVQTTDPEEINLREIRLARRRQVLSPDKITDKEQQIISQYADAMSNYASSISPEIETPEEQAKFKKGFKVERDVAIGGSSTLINALSYTYDALYEGRHFVEELQKIMMNPDDFILIEAWYRSDDEVRDKIDQATKDKWYEGFKDFSATIIEAINNMPNLSKRAENILKGVEEELEVAADEFYNE